jgi:ABC-type phosphate/phosphonate transport system substrate-binding protein
MGSGKALLALIGVAMVLVAGCGSSGSTGNTNGKTQKAYAPSIDPADFTTKIDNKYFPLEPGTTFLL